MKALLRGSLATLVGSVALFVASTALADGEACFDDTDCPGTACGDPVCNWGTSAKVPDGRKTFGCNPAGTKAAGADGWCETDANCKCMGQGAKCVYPYCTFTKPMAGAGGSTSTGGSASTAGTTSTTAGTTSTTAGTTSTTAGTGSTTPAPAADSGGCSVSVPGGVNTGIALGVGLVGLGLAFARRRR